MSDSEERIVLMEMHADKVEQLRQLRATCAEKAAELSRARGEIDAAHVVLTGAGVHRSEGQSVQDRIARYIGETETKLEEALKDYEGVEDERKHAVECAEAAEARATAAEQAAFEERGRHQELERELLARAAAMVTAAEQERDKARKYQNQNAGAAVVLEESLRAAEAKLAAAERREAELRLMLDVESTARFDARVKEALASPSTPSPAPNKGLDKAL
jgi:hypothetical protein